MRHALVPPGTARVAAPGSTTEHPITLTSAEPGADGNRSGGFGIKLDAYKPETGSGPIEPLITVVTKESPNRELVRIGEACAGGRVRSGRVP